MINKIKTIAFDADDTLRVNDPYFQETERKFCALLEDFLPHHSTSQQLFKTEMKNLHLYGYGIKGFMLCMIETAYRVSNGKANFRLIDEVIQLGQELLLKPNELLEGVEEVLDLLLGEYRLVMVTKGDLLDQERKLKQSVLENYFHHIEIMSDKKASDYQKLLKHLDCVPEKFLMIENSIKPDVLPVLELQGYAAHVPYHTTWTHEQHERTLEHPNLIELNAISEIIPYLT
ncbi:putative hydrolase of the HAD superfamily [Pontibacter ummariensis]|uniref:Putative hydrolase of the HAD superfamily n=1 Tax=Pontibacter ummariensis TaxID=1610492 RepID=A0A239KU15_9BACT|nr:HAD family hydrolase [Pontibacter ummariensis]PRY05019.1 putative hydrolase of the HAD superfamily [Pontibacter ummariensis]SNT21222.1 putative hydrolase of the HAD superfamily [Pontibacter ummariensis]